MRQRPAPGRTESFRDLCCLVVSRGGIVQSSLRPSAALAATCPVEMLTDRSTRADATIAAQATGAMSWAFITALKKNPQQSYVGLLNSIRDELARKYSQRPQLSCSHPLSKFNKRRGLVAHSSCFPLKN